jgi:predicted lipoprotein
MYVFPEFKNQIEFQNFIKAALGLKNWHDKKRIQLEVDELF